MCLLFQCQLHLCVTSRDVQISRGEQKPLRRQAAVTQRERNAEGHWDEEGWDAGPGQYGRACFISLVLWKSLLHVMWKREYNQGMNLCDIAHEKVTE